MKSRSAFPGLFSIVIGIIILGFFGGALYYFMGYRKSTQHNEMTKQIAQFADIFHRINKTAHIVGFDKDKVDITFLNIKKDGFTGSQVGLMKLGNPHQWDGPYLEQNPRVQDKYYQIVKTKHGHFIIPGDGVTLPNGKTIGKDVMIKGDTDVMALAKEGQPLFYKGKPLVASVEMTELMLPGTPDIL
jgi:hypothetical protein